MQDSHELHVSERRAFRACRLRWHWGNREHYEPIVPPTALQFGTAFHIGLQAFFDPEQWDSTTASEKYDAAATALESCIRQQRAEFLEATGQANMVSPAFGDDYQERIDLAFAMMYYYAFTIHPKEDTWFRPVKVEVPFRVPLYDPYDLTEPLYCDNSPHCGQWHPNPAPITYDGRVDAIWEDLRSGGYWAVDFKTAGSLMPNDSFLHLDDQISSYVMALMLMLKIDIKGFLYIEFLKGFPREPDQLKRKHNGKLFSVDRRTLTDYETVRNTISERDQLAYKAGLYDEYLDFLRSGDAPQFHKRFPILQSPQKLAIVANNMSKEALDMIDPRIRIYPEVAKVNCNYCQFRTPCMGQFEGDDISYTFKTLYRKKETGDE